MEEIQNEGKEVAKSDAAKSGRGNCGGTAGKGRGEGIGVRGEGGKAGEGRRKDRLCCRRGGCSFHCRQRPADQSREAGERRQNLPCRERGAEFGQRRQERGSGVEATAASCSDNRRGRSSSAAAHEAHSQGNPPRQAYSNNPENGLQCSPRQIFFGSQMDPGSSQFPCLFRQIVDP